LSAIKNGLMPGASGRVGDTLIIALLPSKIKVFNVYTILFWKYFIAILPP
jgi:hypothetical protein